MSLFNASIFDEVPTKCCRKCLVRKPRTDFTARKESRDGRCSWCKACICEKVKAGIPTTLFPTHKTCVRCGESKSIDSFYKRRNTKDGRVSACRTCSSKYSVMNNSLPKNKAKIKSRYRATYMKQRYGLTLQAYDQILASQDGVCAICKSPTSGKEKTPILTVDHDHETGQIRGLLCHHCNVGIGHFKDSVELLAITIRYLERSRA